MTMTDSHPTGTNQHLILKPIVIEDYNYKDSVYESENGSIPREFRVKSCFWGSRWAKALLDLLTRASLNSLDVIRIANFISWAAGVNSCPFICV
jgi:hypothetical protein